MLILAFRSLLFVLLFTSGSFAQAASAASVMADNYLKALISYDLPDSKADLKSYVFLDSDAQPKQYVSSGPTACLDFTTLAERTYATDVPGVSSYRRLLTLKCMYMSGTKTGEEFLEKYVLVAYFDRISKTWKVSHFSKGTDVEREVSSAQARLGEPDSVNEPLLFTPAYSHASYGYWLLAANRINDAKKALEQSLILVADDERELQKDTKTTNDNPFKLAWRVRGSRQAINQYLEIIRRVSHK